MARTGGLRPNPAPVEFNDAFDQSQPHAGPGSSRVELLEKAEQLALVARIDAQSVVPHKENRFVVYRIDADLDAGLGLVSHKLYRVVKEVLEDLGKPRTIAVNQHGGLEQVDPDSAICPATRSLAELTRSTNGNSSGGFIFRPRRESSSKPSSNSCILAAARSM